MGAAGADRCTALLPIQQVGAQVGWQDRRIKGAAGARAVGGLQQEGLQAG